MDGTEFKLIRQSLERLLEYQGQQITYMQAMTNNLQAIYMALAAPEDADDGACHHPEDLRVSLATPRDPDHWVCSACRFEHQGLIQQ